MPRSRHANEQIREDRKVQILHAARKTFASKGFAATTIDDIAHAADISKGLVYHYFTNKADVFSALIEQATEGALQLIRDALAREGTPWERLRWLTVEVVARARREPAAFMVIVQAYVSEGVPESARAIATRHAKATLEAIGDLIVQGQSTGQVVAGDPNRLAGAFTACLQGLALTAAMSLHDGLDAPSDPATTLRMLKA